MGSSFFFAPWGLDAEKTGPHYTHISETGQRGQDAASGSTRTAENDSFANPVSLFRCFKRGTTPPGNRLLAAGRSGGVSFSEKRLKVRCFFFRLKDVEMSWPGIAYRERGLSLWIIEG
jgi:hypothetical protein